MFTAPLALVASSNSEVRETLTHILSCHGVESVVCFTAAGGEGILFRQPVSLGFCQGRLPDGSFRDVLGEVKRSAKLVPVIVVSRLGDWDKCLEALRLGVYDYVAFPFQRAEVESIINHALSTRSVLA